MDRVKFEGLLRELDDNSLETLLRKNARYSAENDRLHNFNAGGDILGGTPAQACWGYMTKHLVALRDMVQKNDFSDRDDFMEKCQDVINYVRFLWCIGNEEIDKCNEKEEEWEEVAKYCDNDVLATEEAYTRYLEEKENEENEDNQ